MCRLWIVERNLLNDYLVRNPLGLLEVEFLALLF